jgi:hypothetical protein
MESLSRLNSKIVVNKIPPSGVRGLLLFLLLTISNFSMAQTLEKRPMIWVKLSDKQAILDKIKTQKWANDYYQKFKERLNEDLKNHQANPKEYLSKMPLDWSKINGSILPMMQFKSNGGLEPEKRQALINYIQTAIDCGVMYYLTNEEPYAQLALDVVYTFVEGMSPLTPSEGGYNGGGYIYLDDHLREAREIGAALPIAYDFVYTFIEKGGKPNDISKGQKGDFSIQNAEKVFKTYIKLALEHGIVDCNWPVLEASSLVGNTLALNDPKERNEFLEYYLTKNTPNQDALLKVANFYTKHGGIWPESLGYANEVSRLSTYLMTLLTRYDAKLDLGNKYPQIPLALTMSYNLTYPNKNQTVLFGDGHRSYHADYETFETAYHLGKISKNPTLLKEFGALLNSAIRTKDYERAELPKRSNGAEVYRDPTHLLWDSNEIEGEIKEYPLPTTNTLPFAGMTIQRNLGSTGNPKDDFMAFVGGGSHVHGHATGMSMELYGKGFVLGPKAGRGSYQTDLHENYFRLFASNNTVVVNGASSTEGGWVNLGQNTVNLVAVEPALKAKPISPNHSFSTSSFVDDKGEQAEAKQERTLGIVRTSPTTGFYVDVFRSKSSLPNEFHDYIYRNLGEELNIETNNKNITLQEDNNRFMTSANKEWTKNRKFRHPGWHFFKEIKTGKVEDEKGLTATFTAQKLQKEPIKMKLFINNPSDREYSTALSPLSSEMPKPYARKDGNTLIIRKKGESWQQPFAVIYEPFEGTGSIQSVENIVQNQQFKGFIVNSLIDRKRSKQIVLVLENSDSVFEDKNLNVYFKGRYGVISLDEKDQLQSAYIGEGSLLKYKNQEINSIGGNAGASYWERIDD